MQGFYTINEKEKALPKDLINFRGYMVSEDDLRKGDVFTSLLNGQWYIVHDDKNGLDIRPWSWLIR